MPFSPVLTIARKRDGDALTRDEIRAFIDGFTAGTVADYQMTALAMAIYLRGMDTEETAALTEAMLESGARFEWPPGAPCVDKHSTGGVGDKVSLILAPLLACCDLHVPMISGRGLGPTGGTLDKLESIPGFRTDLSMSEIRDVTDRIGCVITGASKEIAPADKRLYALRDVTATVASIPLITASIMSKKLAEGLDSLVLDVKFGSGAFMKTLNEARALARSLVNTGHRMGVSTTALLTNMNQPLGRMCGNAVEVDESLRTLQCAGPEDLTTLTLALGAELLVATSRASSLEQGRAILLEHLESGAAEARFREMVETQGGDVDAPRTVAPYHDYRAVRAGYVAAIDTETLGQLIILLGGGRRMVTDPIDCSVGLEMLVRIGDPVTVGQPVVRVFAQDREEDWIHQDLVEAVAIDDTLPDPVELIVERITAEG